MNIKMLKTVPGSPNGLKTYTYAEGAEYSVPFSLGNVFVENKFAVDLDELAEKEEQEAKQAAAEAAKKEAEKAKRQNKQQAPHTEKKEG